MPPKTRNEWADIDEANVDSFIREEQDRGLEKYGRYASFHEAYAVILEELDEFWDSIKARNPDPKELLQVCATARRALLELCQHCLCEREAEKRAALKKETT